MVQVCEERVYEKNVAERLVEFKAVWPHLVEQISSAFSYGTEKKQWLEKKTSPS